MNKTIANVTSLCLFRFNKNSRNVYKSSFAIHLSPSSCFIILSLSDQDMVCWLTSGLFLLLIGHVRYINILAWSRGFRVKIAKFLLSLNSQKRLRHKENNTKYRSLNWKPRNHVRILMYRTWPITHTLRVSFPPGSRARSPNPARPLISSLRSSIVTPTIRACSQTISDFGQLFGSYILYELA